MATRVTLTTPESDDPGSSAHKTSTGQEREDPKVRVSKVKLTNDRGDRRAEADWLWRAARPGIVPIESPPPTASGAHDSAADQFDEGAAPPGFTIVTEHMGSRTLRTARLEPEAARLALIEVAELLIGLHRDGLVHGKLTPDHVIIGADRIWLCSPEGNASDPTDDLDGLARCMIDAERQWAERPEWPLSSSPFREQWAGLAERITDPEDATRSATRALAGLRRLAAPSPSTTREELASPSRRAWRLPSLGPRRGLATAALFACAAIGGLVFAPDDRRAVPDGPRLEVDGAIYAVGSAGDDLVMLDQPCDPDAPVFVLESGTETVWAFDRIGDGERARPIAVVPGATDLRQEWVDRDQPCTHLVARGPAGVTIIDPNL